jgi:hypothetical protein
MTHDELLQELKRNHESFSRQDEETITLKIRGLKKLISMSWQAGFDYANGEADITEDSPKTAGSTEQAPVNRDAVESLRRMFGWGK